MKLYALVVAFSACAALAGLPPARAQDTPPALKLPDLKDTYVPATPADDSLYRALGAAAGVQALAGEFHAALLRDARVRAVFAQADAAQFRQQIALEFCQVSGGPCSRQRNMKKVHAALEINKASFNAVVEVLQATLEARGVPFADQNRLLAQLAPMHRDIITVE